jgi:xanthine/uracil/vitamin C permease (AzgA family)
MSFAEYVDKYFKITERGSTIQTEMRAGLTSFLTLSYILLVHPQVCSTAHEANQHTDVPATSRPWPCLDPRHVSFVLRQAHTQPGTNNAVQVMAKAGLEARDVVTST